jgi:hypothetical protein
MSKLLIIVGLALAAVAIGLLQHSNQATIDALQKSKDRGQIRWHAELARAKGEDSIVFPAGRTHYAVPRTTERALAIHDLVLAEAVTQMSFAADSDREIHTWYKLRVIENLSTHTEECPTCPALPSPPREMLPLNKDEFLISRVGGEVLVDGVKVVSIDSEFPPFESGKRYLLFLSFDPEHVVAAIRMGPWGTFAVGEDDKLDAINQKLNHGVRSELANRFGNSISKLREQLKKAH